MTHFPPTHVISATLGRSCAILCLTSASALAGLTVTKVSGPPSGAGVVIQQTERDESGPTSMRYYAPRAGAPTKTDHWVYKKGASNGGVHGKYYYRDRDLGQTFTTGPEGFKMRAITVRLQPVNVDGGGNPANAKVSLQLMKVTGSPVVNNNGTTKYINAAQASATSPNGTSYWNGAGGTTAGLCTNPQWSTYAAEWPNDPNDLNNRYRWPVMFYSDDYLQGETYTHVAVARGGIIPANLVENDYMRWELSGEDQWQLEPNSTYAFLFLFDEPAPSDGNGGSVNRNIPLSNKNILPEGNLTDPFPSGHMIRRDGASLDREKVFIRDVNDPQDLAEGRFAAEFPTDANGNPDWNARLHVQPGTLGYPDVDTYRDMYFIMEKVSEPAPVPTSKIGSIQQNADFASDPQWTGQGNRDGIDDYGFSPTNYAGGAIGEIGGVLDRGNAYSYYLDMAKNYNFTATDTLRASGTFIIREIPNVTANDDSYFGHLPSISGAFGPQFMVGFRIREHTTPGVFRLQVIAGATPGTDAGGGLLHAGTISSGTPHTFEYIWRADGTFTARLDGNIVVSTMVTRAGLVAGAIAGFGIASRDRSTSASNRAAELYLDNLSYSSMGEGMVITRCQYLPATPAFALTYQSLDGQSFQVRRSPDMVAWQNLADTLEGDGSILTYTDAVPGVERMFYRLSSN